MARLDQAAADGLRTLVRLAQLYPFPDFVKNAERESLRRADCPLGFCADARRPGQFPCDSKAATVVSYAFFVEKESSINPKVRDLIRDRLDGFVEYWGCKRDVAAIKTAHAKLSETHPLPDDAYGLVEVTAGVKTQRYPLRSAGEVKAAAGWFRQHLPTLRDLYDWPTRETLAGKILDKAAAYGTSLPEADQKALEKSANRGFQLPSVLAGQIRMRPKLAHRVEPEVAAQMTALADYVSNQPRRLVSGELAEKVAATLEEFDRLHGLCTKYDHTLLAPEDAVFGVSLKAAEELVGSKCATLSGSVYDKTAFLKLSLAEVRDAFGDDVADSVRSGMYVHPEKMAELAETLPLPDARLLDAIMAKAGAHPAEKLAEERVYPTRNDFAALALLG